jgi:hypothetical protein
MDLELPNYSSGFNIIHIACSKMIVQCLLQLYNSLIQKIYNCTANLLHVSTFFGHHQGAIRQRKRKRFANYDMDVRYTF